MALVLAACSQKLSTLSPNQYPMLPSNLLFEQLPKMAMECSLKAGLRIIIVCTWKSASVMVGKSKSWSWILKCIVVLVIIAVAYTMTYSSKVKDQGLSQQPERPSLRYRETKKKGFIPSKVDVQLLRSNTTAREVLWDEPKLGKEATIHKMPVTAPESERVSNHLLQLKSLSNASPLNQTSLTEPIPLLGPNFTPLARKDIEDVRTFVIFVGFARTGHSIVGTLMDAHPDIIIAHEYNVLKNIKSRLTSGNQVLTLFNNLYKNSHSNAVNGWRSDKKSKKGYNLSMSQDTWQGKVRRLRVIGDKAAGMANHQYMTNPTKCRYLVESMESTFNISMKAIRVLRNPYDIISTKTLYNTIHKVPRNASELAHYASPKVVRKDIFRFIEMASRVNKMVADCQLSVVDIHLADLVNQPDVVMKDLCNSVGVECSPDYIETCAGKVFKTLSKTRHLVKWPPELIEMVKGSIIGRFSEFSRYSYDCDC